MKTELTCSRLKELAAYNQDSGHFVRVLPRGGELAGAVCGTKRADGYVSVCIDRSYYLAHRLAWLYMTGEWPKLDIDHINGSRSDNRWANLRQLARVDNSQNQRAATARNKTGLLGVSPSKGKFAAHIRIDGKNKFLGRYSTPEQAHEVYVAAKRKAHRACTI